MMRAPLHGIDARSFLRFTLKLILDIENSPTQNGILFRTMALTVKLLTAWKHAFELCELATVENIVPLLAAYLLEGGPDRPRAQSC
jgi:hypothetical protein